MGLRKFLDHQLKRSEGKRYRPLIEAIDTFLYETPMQTKTAPHIRDSVDLKRIMVLVVYALIPCILMAIWNTGVQKLVYASGDAALYQAFRASYFEFCKTHATTIVWLGLAAFMPIMLITYLVGGFCEVLFACVRGHAISEGFLVTGILYALILPPTLPYWMVALGVAVGVIISKEIFGGTGYNILNPAMTCRVFLYFTFPTRMVGSVWAGTNPVVTNESIAKMRGVIDGVSEASALSYYNLSPQVTRGDLLDLDSAGLGPELLTQAKGFLALKEGTGVFTDANLFFGNIVGSLGETSTLACLLGAILLLITGIASWRTMAGVILGVLGTAALFKFGSQLYGLSSPANFDFPIYKHLLMGGLAFGLVFMATDPVSSPDLNASKWTYGLIIGALTIVIRAINPAFPEGIMLAILFGNVIAPLIDHHFLKRMRRHAI